MFTVILLSNYRVFISLKVLKQEKSLHSNIKKTWSQLVKFAIVFNLCSKEQNLLINDDSNVTSDH